MDRAPAVPPSSLPPLMAAAGEFVIIWGLTEEVLVHVITIIYQKAGGRHVHAITPIAIKKRREFLRRCVKRIAPLGPFASDLNRILNELTGILVLRHAIVHGAVSGYDPKTGTYTFTKLDLDSKDNMYTLNTVSTKLQDIRGAVLDLQRLTKELSAIANRLMEAFVR